jgi:hypothetical protein
MRIKSKATSPTLQVNSNFSTPSSESTDQWPNEATMHPFTPNMTRKEGRTIEELYIQTPPYGKPGCITNLKRNETIDEAIGRISTSNEMYKMYYLLTQKAKMADQGTPHQKILSQKGRAAVDKALILLAEEQNIERGSLDHTLANTVAQRRTMATMKFDMQTKTIQKIASQQIQDKKYGKSTGMYDEILEEDSPTMRDSMLSLTTTEQLQMMQDKADNIAKLQRELQKDIQDYKLCSLADRLTATDPSALRHNKGTKRELDDAVLWKRVPPGPGVPHTMMTEKGKVRHWCPHHQNWTQHTPEECRIQPVLGEHHKVASNGMRSNNF